MSHSYHSRTTSQTKERSFERSANAKSVIKGAIYLSCARKKENGNGRNLPLNPITCLQNPLWSFFCASLHPSFLLNFLRDRVQFKGTETRDITWRGVRISRNKWRRDDQAARCRWEGTRVVETRWAGGGGEEEENSSCRSHVTGAHIIGSILSISHFLRGSWEESITRFHCSFVYAKILFATMRYLCVVTSCDEISKWKII